MVIINTIAIHAHVLASYRTIFSQLVRQLHVLLCQGQLEASDAILLFGIKENSL